MAEFSIDDQGNITKHDKEEHTRRELLKRGTSYTAGAILGTLGAKGILNHFSNLPRKNSQVPSGNPHDHPPHSPILPPETEAEKKPTTFSEYIRESFETEEDFHKFQNRIKDRQRELPPPNSPAYNKTKEYLHVAQLAASRLGINDPNLIKTAMGLIYTESAGDKNAYNKDSSASGLCQITKPTAEEVSRKLQSLGINIDPEKDISDPLSNITMGIYYLDEQRENFGNLTLGLASYNWGLGFTSNAIGESLLSNPNVTKEDKDFLDANSKNLANHLPKLRGMIERYNITYNDLADNKLLPKETEIYVPKVFAAAYQMTGNLQSDKQIVRTS